MNVNDVVQLMGMVVLIIYELYAIRADEYPIFAKLWDVIAKFAGALANFFGKISITARLAYFEAIK